MSKYDEIAKRVVSATAESAYESNSRSIGILMNSLKKKLKIHSKRFESDGSKGWDYVGDLGYLREKLEEMDNFLRN